MSISRASLTTPECTTVEVNNTTTQRSSLCSSYHSAAEETHRQHTHTRAHLYRLVHVAAPLLTLILCGVLWEIAVHFGQYPEFILPGPLAVLARFRELLADGTLLSNSIVTLQEAVVGFLLAASISFPLGYTLAHVRLAERFFSPLIAASQAIPAVAVAPLLIFWLGIDLAPKVAVCAVIVLFPLLITTITGMRGIDREYREVAYLLGVSRLETLWRVELPLAAPVLLGGIKLGLTLSLTGAVVGEFVAADAGLAVLLNQYRDTLDTPGVFAVLLTLIGIGIVFYISISCVERLIAQWQE